MKNLENIHISQINPNWSNKEKLKYLMDEYGNNVIRLAFTYVRSKHAAEDIAQDVFLKCYENLAQFRGDSSYKTWIYTITANKCKDYLKSWSHKNMIFTEFVGFFNRERTPSTDNLVVSKEENRMISEKVLELPLKYREVIMFYFYEELSIVEIARLLNININTVKSRLLRGKKMIANELRGSGLFD